MNKLMTAALSLLLAFAFGLAAAPARADDDCVSQRKLDKETSRRKDAEAAYADLMAAFQTYQGQALSQIKRVETACTAKINAIASPTPSQSAAAAAIASESASGVVTPAGSAPSPAPSDGTTVIGN